MTSTKPTISINNSNVSSRINFLHKLSFNNKLKLQKTNDPKLFGVKSIQISTKNAKAIRQAKSKMSTIMMIHNLNRS